MSDSSDDSIIEKTPEIKKIKTTKRKSKKSNPIPIKFTDDNNSLLLNQLVAEFERNITQKSTTTNLDLGSSNIEKPTPSTSDFLCKNNQKVVHSVEEDVKISYVDPVIIKQNKSEDPSSNTSDCKNDQKGIQSVQIDVKTSHGYPVVIKQTKSENSTSSTPDFPCKNDQKASCNVHEQAGPSTDTAKKYYTLTDPIQTPFSKNRHNMYVFYLIDELVKFSPNHFPKNCHVQLVGILELYDQEFFLISLEQVYWKRTKVKLDLRDLENWPNCDTRVTIFGVVSFVKDNPIVVVQFFQPATVNYDYFKKLMLRLRTTVPLENFEMVKNSEPDIDLSLNSDNVEHESSELKFEGELGDNTLANFLDEISFETL